MNQIDALSEQEAKILLKKALDHVLERSLTDLQNFEKTRLYDVKCIFKHVENGWFGGNGLIGFYNRVQQEKLYYYCHGYTQIKEFISEGHFYDCFHILEMLFDGCLEDIFEEDNVEKRLLLKYRFSVTDEIDFEEIERATKDSIIVMKKVDNEQEETDFQEQRDESTD